MGKLMKIGLFAWLVAFLASPLAAFTLPDGGSYDELSKLVPANAKIVAYCDAAKLCNLYGQLGNFLGDSELMDQAMPLGKSSAILFAGGMAGASNFMALLYYKNAVEMDVFIEQVNARLKTQGQQAEIVKTEINGMSGFKLLVKNMPFAINCVQLAPGWFLAGISEEAMIAYMDQPNSKLGINPEIAAILAPYKAKMFFGTIEFPKDKVRKMRRLDFMGDITSENICLELVFICPNKDIASEMDNMLKQILPMSLMAADQEIPGISKLLDGCIDSSVAENRFEVDFSMPLAKLSEFIVMVAEYKTKMQEAEATASEPEVVEAELEVEPAEAAKE